MSMLEEKRLAAGARSLLVPRDLVETGPCLHVADGLGKALRRFVEVRSGVLPVVDGDRLLGLLLETDVLDWLADQAPGTHRLELLAAQEKLVVHLMRPAQHLAYADVPIAHAMKVFEQHGQQILPVVDDGDRFVGMLSRATAYAALTRNLRPASVGGMATPLGVYLTTGHVSAGVGFWGLYLSGIALALVNYAIELGLFHAQRLAGVGLPAWAESLAAFALFLVALRLSPLAGYHAAEHQTVNAIEQGEPLELDVIARMPREHPRCGTNLMALLFGVQLLLPLIAHEPLLTLPVVVAGYLAWRKVGHLLQRFFTTKPPRRTQLLDGQSAGVALLAAYSARPGYRVGRWHRIWNMGLVQILAGAFTVLALLEAAYRFFPATRGILL